MSTIVYPRAAGGNADDLAAGGSSHSAAHALMGLESTVVAGLIVNDSTRATAIANSAAINAALTAGDAAGGQEILVNANGTLYLANTLVWGKCKLVISKNTNPKMCASLTTDPIPMFRNFAFANWTNPSTYIVISSMTYSAATGLVTVTTAANHNKALGDDICPWGANQSGYNGTFRVHTVPSPTTLTYRPDVAPTVLAATVSTFLSSLELANVTWSGGTATATTVRPHGISATASGAIAGCVPNGYNGAFTLTSTGTNTFTYPVSNPGASPATTIGGYSFPQMRLYTPDVGGCLECYGVCDFNGLWTAGSGGVGDPGNAGTNGSNAATPTTNNATDFDIVSLLFHRGWEVNFYADQKNSREHGMWICHGRDFTCDHIGISAAGADRVHLTGPLTNIKLGHISGFTNDNLFAIGSSDYIFFNMSEGDIIGVHCQVVNPRGVLFDPFRIIGESQYAIDYVVEEITGSCYSCYAYHLMYDPLMIQGGNVNVRNGEVKRISCLVHNSAIASLQPYTAERLTISNFKLTTDNQIGVIMGGGAASSTAKTIVINDGENIYDSATAGYGDIVYQDVNLTIDKLIINRSIHKRSTNAGTAGNGWTFNQNGGNVKSLVFNDPILDGGTGMFQLSNTIETKIDINNQYTTTPTQIGVTTAGASAKLTVSFNGGKVGMTTGTMISIAGTSTLDVRGAGCYAPGTFDNSVGVANHSASQAMTIHNWDFFIDARSGVTPFSLVRGQYCSSNVGGSNDTRYGACTSNGSLFYTTGTGAAGVNVSNG